MQFLPKGAFGRFKIWKDFWKRLGNISAQRAQKTQKTTVSNVVSTGCIFNAETNSRYGRNISICITVQTFMNTKLGKNQTHQYLSKS